MRTINITKPYYILCERLKGEGWTIQFGDYSRAVVIQEIQDMRESGSHIRGTQYQCVKAANALETSCREALARI